MRLQIFKNFISYTRETSTRDINWEFFKRTPQRVGLKPLAPAHLRVREDGQGGYEVSWIRRSRIGGDDFEAPEIPLGEMSERYHVTLIGPSNSRETWETTSSKFHVTAKKLMPHAGASSLQLQVSQVGSSGLRGYASQIRLR